MKANINAKLKQCFKRQLVNTGSCQLHVVNNTFRKKLESYGEDIENLCIDLFYFFKLSAARREDFLKIQQKLVLGQVVLLRHVESRWLLLLQAAERVKDQFPALLKYFKKLWEADKEIKGIERYRRIMSSQTSPETMVHLYFLESLKTMFDQFLQLFQTEGHLIHILHQSVLQLLKQVMFRFLKQSVVTRKNCE